MVTIDLLKQVIATQKESLDQKSVGMLRDNLNTLPDINNYAMIVSGVRRCGKSTLLHQLLKNKYQKALYINFDDPRLFDFQLSDFQKLDKIITESNIKVLMFDEIQIIQAWERYIRQKLDEQYKIFVTGSNASLLSKELGTSLTGRHISTELFPFSYSEFCRFKKLEKDEKSANLYMQLGGFPEYLQTEYNEILTTLISDILIRDIAIRYNIKDTKALQRLCIYLLSNIGNLTSANKLKEPTGISSVTTILEHLSHLENSYLISLVPKFDYSLKKQAINPKKIYAIDMGLVNANTNNLKADNGHKLENMVYNKLRQHYKEIYYHKNTGECDFIIIDKSLIIDAIQVCYEITPDNQDREFNGLIDALSSYKLTEGKIITFNQEDSFNYNGYTINLIPIYKYL